MVARMAASRADQEELVALALNREPERRVLEQIFVRGFEALARHPDGSAEFHDRGALPGGCPEHANDVRRGGLCIGAGIAFHHRA
jgi:hypothetical protein